MAMQVRGATNGSAEAQAGLKDKKHSVLYRAPVSGNTCTAARLYGGRVVEAPDINTISGFSATCYFFARELSASVSVPMGLINSSVGGTQIQWWTSADALLNDPDNKAAVQRVQSGQVPAQGSYVTSLYNAMIAPLTPIAMAGVVWYQGESNASESMKYRNLLPDGRRLENAFGESSSRFWWSSFPDMGIADGACRDLRLGGLREAQWMAAKMLAALGLQ
jgi:hypothetical protein